MNTKIYTTDEANRTLPLIRAIVADIVAKAKKLEAAKREQRKASARRPRLALETPAEVSERDQAFKREIREIEAQVEDHRRELEELGCYLKDPLEKGLVDFPAYLGTDLVCLCWHVGEERVAHFHGMREGFHDRKPLPQDESDEAAVGRPENSGRHPR